MQSIRDRILWRVDDRLELIRIRDMVGDVEDHIWDIVWEPISDIVDDAVRLPLFVELNKDDVEWINDNEN